MAQMMQCECCQFQLRWQAFIRRFPFEQKFKLKTPTILIPTAGQTTARETADYAMQIAKSLDAKVIALHVIKPGKSSEAGELSLEYFAHAGEASGVEVECHFRTGAVINQIVDFAEENDIDLIVMGASEGRVIEQWLSSDVSQSTAIPVLVIPFQIFD